MPSVDKVSIGLDLSVFGETLLFPRVVILSLNMVH